MEMTNKTLVDIYKIIEAEKAKWMANNDESKIKEVVETFLNASRTNTILNICGMEMETKHWKGKDSPYWRIDHCNGRSGNSPIGSVITDAVKSALEKAVVGFDKLSQAEIEQIRKETHDTYIRFYKNHLYSEAKKLAEQHAKQFIESEISKALQGDAEKIRLMMMESK